MKYLKIKDIIAIHKQFEELYGVDGTILQPSNLEIALEIPKRRIYGNEIFITVTEKAAALMYNLLKLHPFVDGNNRTGFTAAIMFLSQNGCTLKSRSQNEEVDICLNTSKCCISLNQLSIWFNEKSRRIL